MFARTLRSANTQGPTLGLKRIWDRLFERYGRSEMVEHALKKNLNAFSNFKNKDYAKLYNLVDTLTEVESTIVYPQ